jgi:hypothetical protein
MVAFLRHFVPALCYSLRRASRPCGERGELPLLLVGGECFDLLLVVSDYHREAQRPANRERACGERPQREAAGLSRLSLRTSHPTIPQKY